MRSVNQIVDNKEEKQQGKDDGLLGSIPVVGDVADATGVSDALGTVTGIADDLLGAASLGLLDGAVDGIRAVEAQSMTGKIIVYPSCRGLTLTPLEELGAKHPEVTACMDGNRWTSEAEKKLLEVYANA